MCKGGGAWREPKASSEKKAWRSSSREMGAYRSSAENHTGTTSFLNALGGDAVAGDEIVGDEIIELGEGPL